MVAVVKKLLLAALVLMLAINTALADTETPLYATSAGTGVHTATDSKGNVYLGGNYLEVGLNKYGTFGIYGADVPEQFHTGWFLKNTKYAATSNGNGKRLGLLCDGDGWNKGDDPVTGDFFVPGNPYESYSFQYNIDSDGDGEPETHTIIVATSRSGASISTYGFSESAWLQEPETKQVGTGLKAVTTAVTGDNVKLTITQSFDVDSLYFATSVEVQNNSGKDISDVYYCREFDPDQDQWFTGNFSTYNKVVATPDRTIPGSAENCAMVIARGSDTGAGFFFLSFDNRATAIHAAWSGYQGAMDGDVSTIQRYIQKNTVSSHSYDESEDYTYVKGVSPNYNTMVNTYGYTYEDRDIGIVCAFGDIPSGKKDTFNYDSSLDPDVERSVKAAIEKQKKQTPTLTVSGTTIHAGDTLNTSKLKGTATVNGKKVSGTFIWESGDSIYPELSDSESTLYTVKFVPNDTKNYNSVITEISIKVVDRDVPITGDNSHMMLWMLLAAVSLAGIAFSVSSFRKGYSSRH